MERIPHVELLRAMATVGIFVFHLWSVVPLSAHGGLFGPVLARLPLLGTLGVIVFNLITGFVLSMPYLGPQHRRPLPTAPDFWRRRFSRICLHYYPALLLWTLLWIIAPAWIVRSEPDQSPLQVLQAFVTHLLFVHTLSASTFFAIVPAFWWLGLLAQFYLVFPWLVRVFVGQGPGWACLEMCVCSWVLWTGLIYVAQQDAGSRMAMVEYLAYFNLPVRLPEFAIGMWLASAWTRQWPIIGAPRQEAGQPPLIAVTLGPLLVGVVLFALLDPAVPARLASPFGHIYLVGWCVLGVLAVRRWSGAAWLGGGRPILQLAAASYSIYLLHQPLLGATERWLPGTFSPPTRFVVLLVAVGVLCYEVALVLDHLATRLARAWFGN